MSRIQHVGGAHPASDGQVRSGRTKVDDLPHRGSPARLVLCGQSARIVGRYGRLQGAFAEQTAAPLPASGRTANRRQRGHHQLRTAAHERVHHAMVSSNVINKTTIPKRNQVTSLKFCQIITRNNENR